MPLLNHVIYFLFLYSDHLYFLESSFWIQQQLVCYWKSQDISSTCLPVSMFKVVTSDFLACGIQKVLLYIYIFFCIEAFILDFFFFPVCLLASLGTDPNPSENQWTPLQSDSWLLFLWDYCHQRLLSSELILDLKDFILNSMFQSKSLGFIVMILCVYGHSFNSYIYFSTGFQQDFCLQWES